MQSGDGMILLLITLGLGVWMYRYMRNRIREEVEAEEEISFPLLSIDDEAPDDEAARLLRAQGYEVLCGRKKIGIDIQAGTREALQSRLFIDYVAVRKEAYYIVKLAKERRPLEHTGSAVRERLLVYQLLYPNTAGVLYVNLQSGTVDCYTFDLQVSEE